MGQKLRRLLPLLASALAVAAVGMALGDANRASAAPVGAATNIHVSQQYCAANGTVTATFRWNPSYLGTQWFDVSTKDDNFSSSYWPFGPYAANTSQIQLNNLYPHVTYVIRVTTWNGHTWLISDTFYFRPTACGGVSFSPPYNLHANVSGDDVQVSWTRGSDNDWFCLDTAPSLHELFSFSGNWRNWGCGTTGTQINAYDLGCDRLYYARVWAVGDSGAGHSGYITFRTDPCHVGAPYNLHSNVLDKDSVRFSWTPGANNIWFCVDTATSIHELVNFFGSFRNHGCGTTSTVWTAHDFDCGTEYVWRVWGWGPYGGRHSEIRSFTTPDCYDFTVPDDLRTEVAEGRGVRFEWDPGKDNIWFCLDTATSKHDLLHFEDSWTNHGCGTTNDYVVVPVEDLPCDETYYWRVYAVGHKASGHSEIAVVEFDCNGG